MKSIVHTLSLKEGFFFSFCVLVLCLCYLLPVLFLGLSVIVLASVIIWRIKIHIYKKKGLDLFAA